MFTRQIEKANEFFKKVIFLSIKIIAVILVSILVYGFICPYMVSSLIDEMVLGGFLLQIAYSIGLIFILWKLIANFIKEV